MRQREESGSLLRATRPVSGCSRSQAQVQSSSLYPVGRSSRGWRDLEGHRLAGHQPSRAADRPSQQPRGSPGGSRFSYEHAEDTGSLRARLPTGKKGQVSGGPWGPKTSSPLPPPPELRAQPRRPGPGVRSDTERSADVAPHGQHMGHEWAAW